jgi:hypothetical protein
MSRQTQGQQMDTCHPALYIVHPSELDDPEKVPAAAEVTEVITERLEDAGWSNPWDFLLDVREGTVMIQDEVPPADPVEWYGVIAVFDQSEATMTHGYNKVGRPAIQQYNTLQQQEPNIDSVIVVTSSEFSSEANKLSEDLNIKTVNGKELAEACLTHFSERKVSDITMRSLENSNDSMINRGKNPNPSKTIATDDLNETELDLAKLYQRYIRGLNKNANAESCERSLLFYIDTDHDETSQYVVEGGTVHKVKFPSDSEKLLAQLQQTAEKYGWEVLLMEAYGPGAGGVEIIVPLEEGDMFYMCFDTISDKSPSAKRQAKISSMILDRVYDQDLSGTEVSASGLSHDGDSHRRVIK